MSRKPKRGYFVRGQFVAEGSELDLELKRQSKGDTETSKTDLKRESAALQDLGEQLLTLRADLMQPLALSDKLLEALQEAKRISNFEGRRRQMQFIGKLMRKLDDEAITSIRAALQQQKDGSASELAVLHLAEQWREQMLQDTSREQALTQWLQQHPATDAQHLRALVRQARKDAQNAAKEAAANTTTTATDAANASKTAPRQGKAYRELFQLIRQALLQGLAGNADNAHAQADGVEESDSDLAEF